MGDRCYVNLCCLKRDKDRLLKVLFPDYNKATDIEEELPNGIIALGLSECNYALYDEMHEAAKQGINFYGEHTSGGEYPAGCFVSYRKSLHFVDANSCNNFPVVTVREDGKINKKELTEVRLYWKKLRAIQAWMKTNKKDLGE